MTDKMLQGNL